MLPPGAIFAAYATARARLSTARSEVDGYRLFWVQGGEVGWKDLPAGGAYAVVGTHECCDVILSAPGVTVRHLLAATVALDGGDGLRLMHLVPWYPFVAPDGAEHQSVVVVGPVVMGLGDAVIGAVPIDAGRAPAPPGPDLRLPELAVERSSRVPSGWLASRVPGLTPVPLSDEAPDSSWPSFTRVTSMPLACHIETIPSRQRFGSAPPGGTGGAWTISLEREEQRASVSLSDDELSVGVMIGRSVACLDQGLQKVLSGNISRGHVLLLHHHDAYEAFDLCSMNGTQDGEGPMRRRRLGTDPVTMHLAPETDMPVLLRWHGCEEPGGEDLRGPLSIEPE
jgi:hypothetical protein